MMELTSAIDSFLPRKIVKKHPTDCPWISKKTEILHSQKTICISQTWKGLLELHILEEQGPG